MPMPYIVDGQGRPIYLPSYPVEFVRVVVPPAFAILSRMDMTRSLSLSQFMHDEGLVPSQQEELRRRRVIDHLKKIIMDWIKTVARRCSIPKDHIAAASATILTYGSYGLGVHDSESDIDALCVAPYFATMAEDFFNVLHNMLASRPEVSKILCIKDARVPLMRFEFDGISIDLPYAQLKVASVPENVDLLNPFFLSGIDDTSLLSLSGVRANKKILQLVPNAEKFQSLLRCVKLWAKRRGVYGNLHGFLGGVHLAILAAYVCQWFPNANLGFLFSIFFQTFAFWPWPKTPVMLHDGTMESIMPRKTCFLMPIRLPCSPYEYCHSKITNSTFLRIKEEFVLGHDLTKKKDLNYSSLFESFAYQKRYKQFVKICLSASDQGALQDWAGWIKSRFRTLLLKLEEVFDFCDPNSSEHVDFDVAQPNIAFYWGLRPDRSYFMDLDRVKKEFMEQIIYGGCQGSRGEISLSIVEASQLPKACWD